MVPAIVRFLSSNLKLELHPDKVSIETLASGVDFLGWVHFPDHRVLRPSTRRRMLKRTHGSGGDRMLASYRGLLRHGNAEKLRKRILAGYSLHVIESRDV